MTEWFTDEEMERIDQFAKSSRYARDPTMLLPDQESESDEE
jgi:hypothetical protein